MSRSHVWHLLDGATTPRTSTLEQLALTLRVPVTLLRANGSTFQAIDPLLSQHTTYKFFLARAAPSLTIIANEMRRLLESEDGDDAVKWSDRIREDANSAIRRTEKVHEYQPERLLPLAFGACIGAHWGGERGALVGGLYSFHLRDTIGPSCLGGHEFPGPTLVAVLRDYLQGNR